MKKITAIVILCVSVSYGFAQKVAGLANVIHGKVVFIEANPAEQYRHQGTIECSIAAPDNFERMMYHMIEKKAFKESAESEEHEEIEFDALIFRPGTGFCKADLIQFYSEDGRKRTKRDGEEVDERFRKSETVLHNGVNLFVENTPTAEFTLLGKLEMPQNFETEKYEELLSQMIITAREAYPEMNGIVFKPGSQFRKADIIKIE